MQATAKSPLTCLPKARLITIDLFVFLSVGTRVLYPSNYLSVAPSIHQSLYVSITIIITIICLFACLSICLAIHLPINLTTYHLYTYFLLILDKHGSWKLGERRGLPCILESPPLIVSTCTSVLRTCLSWQASRSLGGLWKILVEGKFTKKFHTIFSHPAFPS